MAFRNLYAFLSQVIPFSDPDLEKLYTFVRFLHAQAAAARQRRRSTTSTTRWRCSYYRLQKISEGAIALQPGEAEPLDGPTEVGTGVAEDEKVELSADHRDPQRALRHRRSPQADQLFFEPDPRGGRRRRGAAAGRRRPTRSTTSSCVFDKALEGLFIDRMDQNESITARFLDDKDFRGAVSRHLMKQVYEQIRGEALAV